MYKPGKESERSHLRNDMKDECKDHLKSGVSHRETINEDVLAKREMEKLYGGAL